MEILCRTLQCCILCASKMFSFPFCFSLSSLSSDSVCATFLRRRWSASKMVICLVWGAASLVFFRTSRTQLNWSTYLPACDPIPFPISAGRRLSRLSELISWGAKLSHIKCGNRFLFFFLFFFPLFLPLFRSFSAGPLTALNLIIT